MIHPGAARRNKSHNQMREFSWFLDAAAVLWLCLTRALSVGTPAVAIGPSGGTDMRLRRAGFLALGPIAMITFLSGPANGGVADCDVTGTPMSETLVGTSGDDHICGLEGDDRIFGLSGEDSIEGGPGDDVIFGGRDGDGGYGGYGDDAIHGGPVRDGLYGGPGKDHLFGGRSNDQLYGDCGRDVLHGGRGDDERLADWCGRDVLAGGRGDEHCIIAVDRHGGDKINGGRGFDVYVNDPGDLVVRAERRSVYLCD
jgi:RTX calcium-binding nonapeptide repeat (4 copies)